MFGLLHPMSVGFSFNGVDCKVLQTKIERSQMICSLPRSQSLIDTALDISKIFFSQEVDGDIIMADLPKSELAEGLDGMETDLRSLFEKQQERHATLREIFLVVEEKEPRNSIDEPRVTLAFSSLDEARTAAAMHIRCMERQRWQRSGMPRKISPYDDLGYERLFDERLFPDGPDGTWIVLKDDGGVNCMQGKVGGTTFTVERHTVHVSVKVEPWLENMLQNDGRAELRRL